MSLFLSWTRNFADLGAGRQLMVCDMRVHCLITEHVPVLIDLAGHFMICSSMCSRVLCTHLLSLRSHDTCIVAIMMLRPQCLLQGSKCLHVHYGTVKSLQPCFRVLAGRRAFQAFAFQRVHMCACSRDGSLRFSKQSLKLVNSVVLLWASNSGSE